MLEKMFNLEYPLPKMDILCVRFRPNSVNVSSIMLTITKDQRGPRFGDLSSNFFMASQLLSLAGALENWGLIVGDPGAFLFDPATGSTATQKRVVDITSHELAHQW
jgi:aminopeptidase N